MGQAILDRIGRNRRLGLGICAVSATMLTADIAEAQFFWSSTPSYSQRVRPRLVRPAATPRREPAQVASLAKPQKPEAAPAPYPMLAVISIGAQRATFYDKSGSPVVTTPVSTGQAGHRTPMGIFNVIQKERYHTSNIYSGAPMPYMQRITWSGIAFHEGHLPGYPASHGCIRMPGSTAAKLFGMTKIGMRVVIAPHDVTPTSFSHAGLFEPIMTAAPANQAPQRASDAGTVRVAAGEPTSDASPPPGVVTAFLNPHQRAVANRAQAKAAHVASIQHQKTALDASQRASAEANQAGNDLRAAQAQEAQAQARLSAARSAAAAAATPEAQAVQQQAVAAAQAALADASKRVTDLASQEAALSKRAYEAAVASREADEAIGTAEKAARLAEKGTEPVSVFISRKEGKVFVRQGFEPILEAPVTFKGEGPLGTHLFVAMDADHGSGRLSWTSVTVPNSTGITANVDRPPVKRGQPAPAPEPVGRASTAAEALSRVELAQDIRQKISDRAWLGASVIVSDLGISHETGKHTDFIVLTK